MVSIALSLPYHKSKLYKTLDYWSRDMLNCKCLRLVLHYILCMIFQEKCFSCCILLTDQISLSDLIFLIKPFWYMTKKSRQKLKYLENGKSFWGEIKSIFHRFQRIFSCQRSSQTWDCAFKEAVIWRCYVKRVFLKISQNSQENTCARISIKLLKNYYLKY